MRYDGTPLPDSPFPVAAVRGCNPQKVKAYGDGLERGIVDEPNTFTIETRNAGKIFDSVQSSRYSICLFATGRFENGCLGHW